MDFKPNRLYYEAEFPKMDIQVGDIVLAVVNRFIVPTLFCQVKGKNAIMQVSDVAECNETDPAELEWRNKTAQAFVGKKVIARVNRIDPNGVIILERKSIVDETKNHLRKMIGKESIYCTVESIAPFGIFADIGNGIIALIHNTEISKSRYYGLKNFFKVGDMLKVRIKNYGAQRDVFQLSRKDAYEPITEEMFPYGSVVVVIIHKYVDEQKSGVFVEYDPGNSGIVDIPFNGHPEEFYEFRKMAVRIKSVKPSGFKAAFLHFVD